MGQLRTDASDGIATTGTGGSPARAPTSQEIALPFQARPVFVVIGMHRSGASVLAKMLQLLGVDMAEDQAADGARWERPEIVAINTRLLEIVGRPLGHAAHALPFPPGWWGDPAVQAVKRDAQALLRAALADRYGMWGFKDLRVTRLLPFWQQLFDEMGLRPAYLWAVRDPAASAASAVASGLAATPEIAEAMWFIYNADAHKFVGDEAAAIVDYRDWTEAPADVLSRLLDRLPLSWRGSHGELLECVRAIAAERRPDAATPSPIHSPLVQGFFEAIRDPEPSEKNRRLRGSVTQAVDILRTLVSPYAVLLGAADRPQPAIAAPAAAPDHAHASAAARAEEAEAALRATEEVLTQEIEARASENAWLQQQYLEAKRQLAQGEEKLRDALGGQAAETARLRLELETGTVQQEEAQRQLAEVQNASDRQRTALKEELEQVRRELALQKTANEKYLSRIYELRASLKTGDTAGAAG